MYYPLAQKMAVTSSSTGYTQAVSMEGANAVMIDATLIVKGAGDVVVTLEGCNDLENWSTVSAGSITFTAVGYMSDDASAIAFRYVRLKVTQASTGTGIIALGINTAQL